MTQPDNHAAEPRAASDLEAALELRRVELRMSWRDVSTAAGMSYEGLRAIRKGDRHPNAVTKARLEDALGWAPGSVDAALAGRVPKLAEAKPSVTQDSAELEQIVEDLAHIVERIRRLAGAGLRPRP